MNYILPLIIFLFFIPLAGKSQSRNYLAKRNNCGKINNDNLTYDFNGKVKCVYTLVYFCDDNSTLDSVKWYLRSYDTDRYNRDGFKTENISFIPKEREIMKYIYTFNKNDDVIKERGCSPPFPGSTYADTAMNYVKYFIYKYNSRGQVIEQNATLNGDFLSQYRYKVDSAGNNLEEREYRHIDTLTEMWMYKYDKMGNAIEEEHAWDSTMFMEQYRFTYDSAGHKLQINSYEGDGTLDFSETAQYDDKGNFLGYESKGIKLDSYNIISSRDGKGNWLSEITIFKGKPYIKCERTIQYY